MALTWRFEDDAVRDATNTNGTNLYVMGVLCIHAGMPSITADNAHELYRRVSILEADDVFGPLRGNDKGMIRFTMEECRSFVGFRTNVTPYTERKFAAHVNRIRGGR